MPLSKRLKREGAVNFRLTVLRGADRSHQIFTTSTGPYNVIPPVVRVLSNNSGYQYTRNKGMPDKFFIPVDY